MLMLPPSWMSAAVCWGRVVPDNDRWVRRAARLARRVRRDGTCRCRGHWCLRRWSRSPPAGLWARGDRGRSTQPSSPPAGREVRPGREARITCLNQLRHLGFCGPDDLREAFRGVPRTALATRAAGLRPRAGSHDVTYATKLAMRTLGRRVLAIEADNTQLDTPLPDPVETPAAGLLAVQGGGVDTAAILLVAAGDNPERIRSEAAWAHLCGVAPLPASSGKLTRLPSDPRTRVYVERRLNEGRSKPEITRVLKRYVAREVYRHLPRT